MSDPERVIWELCFEREHDDDDTEYYSAFVYGPPPDSAADPWYAVPAGVRVAAQTDGRYNDATRVEYAVSYLADVSEYTDAAPRGCAGSRCTIHDEPIRRTP